MAGNILSYITLQIRYTPSSSARHLASRRELLISLSLLFFSLSLFQIILFVAVSFLNGISMWWRVLCEGISEWISFLFVQYGEEMIALENHKVTAARRRWRRERDLIPEMRDRIQFMRILIPSWYLWYLQSVLSVCACDVIRFVNCCLYPKVWH